MAKSRQLPPPSLDYLRELRTELETSIYEAQDAQIDEDRAARELRDPVVIPDGAKVVDFTARDPTLTDEAFRISASWAVNRPKCVVTNAGRGERGTENATRREHHTEEAFWLAGKQAGLPNAHTLLVDSVTNDGGGWLELAHVKDLWDEVYRERKEGFDDVADETAKQRAGPPIKIRAVDPRAIYPVYAGGQLTEVLEVQERPQSTTFRQYRLKRDSAGNIVPDELGQGTPANQSGSINNVIFLKHCDGTYYSYAVVGQNDKGDPTGQPVQQWKHRLSRPPYFFAPGLWMSHWRNRKVGWGIGHAKAWLVKYRSFLWTIQANMAARDVKGTFYRRQPDGAAPILGLDGKPLGNESLELGVIYNTQPGEEILPVQFPQTPEALARQMAIIDQAIAKLDTPRPNGDLGAMGDSGFAISQVLAELKVRFDPIAQGVENCYEEMSQYYWWLIRNKIKERVWVFGGDNGWLGLGPDDLKDMVGVRWTLDPERPTAKIIEGRYHAEQVKAGFESMDQAIEAQGRNPDEVLLGRMTDEMRATPEYKLAYKERMLHSVGRGDLLAKAAELARTGGPAGAPPNGGNPMGQVVPDTAALAMAPNGAGAVPPNGAMMGTGPGAVVPQNGAAAGIGPGGMG